MDKLVLISGLTEKKISKLDKFVKKYFCDNHLQKIWNDPKQKERAVIMFQETVDLENILKSNCDVWEKQRLVIRLEKPTQNIFVRTYKLKLFGLIDKLGYFLAKRSHFTVSDKTQLDDDCFEFTLKEGLDAVLAVCEKVWTWGNTELTVCPYFDGFKECYKDQYASLLKQNKLELKNISQNTEEHINLLLTGTSTDFQISSVAINNQKFSSLQMNFKKTNTGEDFITTFCYLKKQNLSDILELLNINEAVQLHNCTINFEDEIAEIFGPKSTVKNLHKLISEEDTKLMALANSLTVTMLPEFKNSKLIISENGNDLKLDVAVEYGQKVPFQDFVQKHMFDVENVQFLLYDLQSIEEDDTGVSCFNCSTCKFHHPFILDILEAFNLQKALQKRYVGTKVEYDKLETKIKITGPSEMKSIILTIRQEVKKITLNGVQKLFLEKPEVLHEIRSMNHEIDFCDPDKMLIKENSSTQGFSDYVNTLVVLEKIEFEKIHTASLNKFLSSFNLQHKLCFAVALQNTIHFLCLRHELVLGSKDILIKSIKDTLQEMQDDNKGAVSSSQENIASHEESLSINEHTDRRQHKGIKINPFFLWLLNELHLQEALRFTFQGIGVKIDFEKSKIKIENFDNSLHICLEIVKICDEKQDSLSDNAQQFLKKGSIMNYIKEKIDFLRYHFVVHQENSFACVRDRQNKEIHFGEFLSGVMLRNNIISLKYQNSQFSPHLLKFIEHFNVEISPDHCLILEGANIILYTVLVYDVSIISQILESFFSHMPEDLVKYVSTHCYFSKLEKNISQVECKLTEYQYEYCKIFLDVHNLKELINFELQHKGLINFELQQDKLIIICIYRYRHSILGYFKSFTENLMQEIHDFDICGLTEFALLNEGHKIISEISQSSKCYIAIPTDKIKLVTDFEDIKAETKDYKVILIQTAKFEGLHIHLVQGKIDDLETSMSILFQPTQNPTFSFQHLKTRSHAIVLLVPAWFANGQDFTNLNKLRKSFETWIYAVFDQAKLHQCFTIAFSTEKMHDSEYPFPLDVLAKTVLECLFQKVSSLNASAGATSITENYDIYICEPYHESVFKAFQYFMDTLYNTKFDTPDQEKWDKISPTCTSKYSGQLHNTVTIKSSNPSTVTQNVLFCYPISPSLKVSTCPVVNEKDCSSRMLEDSVKRYEDSCPDGIPLNGHFPARCFQYTYKDVMLYCCPEWGLNASKVIYDSLNVCLFQATNKNAVHIVPPGTYASKYPAKYLAQAVFKAVDMFLQEGIVQKHLHIVFILEDQDYREAFDKELAKCQTNKNKRSIINTLMSYVWPPLGYHSKAEPSSVKSEVEKTSVIFVSESAECVSKAVTQLYSKLIELMSYNKEVIDVSEDELGIWKDFISKEHKHPVVLVLIDAKKMNRKKKKKHSSKRMVSITGLHKQWIADFKNVILRQSNPKQLSNSTAILNTNAPNVKYKSSSVDKCNHIKSCKGNVKQESLANYKKDKDELTMSSSSPESLESSQKLSITKSEDENCEFTGEFKKNELDSFDDKKGKADFKNSSSSSPESLESSQKLSITKSEDENCEFTGELKKNELDSFDDKKGKADFKNSSSSSPESLESSQKLSITKNEDENCEYTGELKKNELDSFDDKKGKADFKNSSSSSPESLESSQKLSITKSEDENCEFTGELKKNELDSFDDKKGKGDFKNSSRSHVSKKRSRKSNFPESEDKNCEYTWKVENTENDCFEEVDPQKNEYFEKIYLKDKAPNKKFRRDLQVWKPFLKIDFFNMIILSEGHQTVKIIRSEKIKEEDNIIFPKHWKKFDDETLHLIESEHLEVENYIKELKNNFEIIKIEEVQNKDLYSRFQSKRNLMPNAEQKMLLHMASEDSVKKVCKFGFQRTFSAFLTEFSGIGEGVAFTSSVDTCYQNYKNKTTQDISLFIAAVVTGESAPSTEKRYVRSPPAKCHSIQKDDIFMIFSDAQAYPCYLIKLSSKQES